MTRYIEVWDRLQALLLPECVDDYVDEDNCVRVIEVFADRLNLAELGFQRAAPAETGRPAYHPGTLPKLYIYGYPNRIPSSRRLEREAQRNLELVWLLGHLAPDFKTMADFRRDNGAAIQATCRRLVLITAPPNATTGRPNSSRVGVFTQPLPISVIHGWEPTAPEQT